MAIVTIRGVRFSRILVASQVAREGCSQSGFFEAFPGARAISRGSRGRWVDSGVVKPTTHLHVSGECTRL